MIAHGDLAHATQPAAPPGLPFFRPATSSLKSTAFGGVDLRHEMRHRADLEDVKWRIVMTPDLETPSVDQAPAVAGTTEQPNGAVERAAEASAPAPAETAE